MAVLARDRKRRGLPLNEPKAWDPGHVKNPSSNLKLPMTNEQAWDFIATKLEEGHDVEEVELDMPPNTTGYVMKVQLGRTNQLLYVKFRLHQNKILGRSFHYSDYLEEE